jgi:hypothetical protein
MSKRHHVLAFVLLSSSAAFASPALTDDDGFPLVGNMHGKRSGAKPRISRETRLATAQRASAVAARAELVAFVEARFQTLTDRDGYPLVGNMHGKSSDDEVTTTVAETPLVVPGDRSACETAIQLALASE